MLPGYDQRSLLLKQLHRGCLGWRREGTQRPRLPDVRQPVDSVRGEQADQLCAGGTQKRSYIGDGPAGAGLRLPVRLLDLFATAAWPPGT
jgi:hypothetical protein